MSTVPRWLLSCLFMFIFVDAQKYVTIQSPGFPHGYRSQNVSTTTPVANVSVASGLGISFLFNRIALGPGHYLLICAFDGSNCRKKQDPSPFFYYALNEASISLVMPGGNDERIYAGFQAQVREITKTDLKNYFQCNQTVDLSQPGTDAPYFLLSQNYGTKLPVEFGNCIVNFKSANKAIKIVVEDYEKKGENIGSLTGVFVGGDKQEVFTLTPYNDPRAYYFKGEAQFMMNSTNILYQFFIRLEQYNIEPKTDNCIGTGVVDVANKKNVDIVSNNLTLGYNSDQNCVWKFTSIPPKSQALLEFYADFEPCCDGLVVTGVGAMNATELRGHSEYTFLFSSQQNVELQLTSDALDEYVGFKGSLSMLDCECPNSDIKLNDSFHGINLYSPGFQSGMKTYCENLHCRWNIEYPRDYILQVRSRTLELYENDTTIFLDSNNIPKDPRSVSYDGAGKTSLLFDTKQKLNYNNTTPGALKTGFQFTISLIKTNNTFVTVDLCKTTTVSFDSSRAPMLNDAVVYTFRTDSCNKKIKIYNFLTRPMLPFFSLTVFDGELQTGTPLTIELDQSGSGMSISNITSNVATVKIVRTNSNPGISKELYGLATAVSNDGRCGLQVHSTQLAMIYDFHSSSCTHTFYYDFLEEYQFSGIIPSVSKADLKSIRMYKGVVPRAEYMVIGPSGEQPEFVYGPFLTIEASSSFTLSIGSATRSISYAIPLSSTPGVFMTKYFASDSNPSIKQSQTIILQRADKKHVINVKMLKSLVQKESVIAQHFIGDRVTKAMTFYAHDGDFKIETDVDTLMLSYNSPEVYSGGGMLVAYSENKGSARNLLSAIVATVFVTIFL